MIDFLPYGKGRRHCFLPLFMVALCLLSGAAKAGADEILVIGDNRLKPVVQVIEGIKEEVSGELRIYKPKDVRGKLDRIVKQRDVNTVIALGGESIRESLALPTSVTVLYALVILPPENDRPNTAGMYIGTPIRKYVEIINSYFPEIEKICAIGTPRIIDILDSESSPGITIYKVSDSFDFVETVKGLKAADALLLLPDVSLMTRTAIEESYLFSFRRKVPLLGISKIHVRQGSLLALEFDPERVGRQLGIMAQAAMEGREIVQGRDIPPQYYNIYVNKETARKMGITIPRDLLKQAEAVYP